jgi:hypothetical protein
MGMDAVEELKEIVSPGVEINPLGKAQRWI